MSGVKRYNLRQNMPATATTFLPDVVVSASDYDRDIQALKAERNAQLVGVCLERDTLRAANQRLEGEVARLHKLLGWMSSGAKEGWDEVCRVGAVATYLGHPDALEYLDSLPECSVGLAALAGDGGDV